MIREKALNSSWRKSTHSTKDQCVEVSKPERHLAVRDSTDPAGPQIAFRAPAWHHFTTRLKQTP
jgi:hypothetical protein